jgi:MtaA/CmuA family methyltransferase
MDSSERFMKALRGDPVDRVPLFPLLMFFAADRAGLSFREYATNGHALAHAQLKMLDRWGLDAITVCSDAFRLPADLGGDMQYPEERTPSMSEPLVRSKADLKKLKRPDPTAAGSRMGDRVEAVRVMAEAAGDRCVIVGWVEMPFAEACSLCGVQNFMLMLYEKPDLAHKVLEWVTDIEVEFGRAQLEAGADMIGAGDAAASMLSPKLFGEFALPYERRVVDGIHDAGGLIKLHICGDTSRLIDQMAQAGADLYNVDHQVKLAEAKRVYKEYGRCLKGNVNPVEEMMRSTPKKCEALCHKCINIAGPEGYMLSAGCEVPAATTDEVFEAFCRAPETYKGK